MKKLLEGFASQWTKWVAVGLLTILACMAYVYMAKEWSMFRLLLILVAGLALGLVEHHIPGPSKIFKWENGSRLLGATLIILFVASIAPKRTAKAIHWVSTHVDENETTATPAKSTPAPAATAPKPATIRTKRIPINADAWSEPQTIPVGDKFVVIDEEGPGHIKVKFWNGQIVSDADPNGTPAPKWEGVVENCTFQVQRISGDGTALLTVTSRS